MSILQRTPLFDRHVLLGAKIVEFGGWEMPLQYPKGIIDEHLATRKGAGLFDVSHMGRFHIRGSGGLRFLQHVLSNNAEALSSIDRGAQYTLIPTESGGAVDDAYLYSFVEDEYLLVVNAANRQKDWKHFKTLLADFNDVDLQDQTEAIVMLALQGPKSRGILERVIETGQLPEPMRNAVSRISISGSSVDVARTGYTGEPLCFELFVSKDAGLLIWDQLVSQGAEPVGLGARDTLRLEAGLPLYGHELGVDPEGMEIPIMACPLAKSAVSFSPRKGDYIGKSALESQFEALSGIIKRDYSHLSQLPRMIKPIAVVGKGIARAGMKIFTGNKHVGYVTSGTMAPVWEVKGEGLSSSLTKAQKLRPIGLAYMDSDIQKDEKISIEIRGRHVDGVVVEYHMRSEAPPYARPILIDHKAPIRESPVGDVKEKVRKLLKNSIDNSYWRQYECINLIPSEMTSSPMTRLLSIMDPSFRYAEHRISKAFYDTEIFYYQGTDFIEEVEQLLVGELCKYLECTTVETRLISGQMANVAVFSAMLDYINRTDRKREPRRIRMVMNNHIGKGGHLSAQPMGALRDFVARDPVRERPAVVNFPVMVENPYKIDIPVTLELIDKYQPELIIFGKSMVLHKEPVSEVRYFLDTQGIDAVVMYDMAHVLGLIGPHFQQPFDEGADLVTGSTHKTYFGTQRGIVGSSWQEHEERYALWEALERRTFPGSTSNHHLGTMLGLLMAAYEMNHFRDEYQPRVIANAKTFARGLKDAGLDVAGDPTIDFTETHQVVVRVGYALGPEIAGRLEANNIICNFQAAPDEESFTASGALRMGVSEMTRFGMKEEDFKVLAGLISEVVLHNNNVIDQIKALRKQFCDLLYTFKDDEFDDLVQRLHLLVGSAAGS